jgi:hypothetical protein
MNYPRLAARCARPSRLRGFLAVPAALIASSLIHAQVAPTTAQPEPEGDVIVLSPFLVTGDEDSGYLATTTLAGGRIRTPVSDVGAAISIVTEDFLRDTGSTNLRDVLVYTTGTEVTGLGGNFGGSGIATEEATDVTISNNVGTRVRGLASADTTRGFFRSLIPFDAYNSNRLEINRGANAILFGVGSPAGIVNYSPNIADLRRTFGSAEVRFDRFGTVRSSVDLNLPMAERQAALRVAVLRDDRRFQQKPAFNRDERGYAQLALSPDALRTRNGVLSGTTLRLSGETGEIEGNNPRSQSPADRLTTWFEPTDRMRQFGITPKATNNVSRNFVQGNGISVAQNLNRSPIVHFPDHTSTVPSAPPRLGGPPIIGRQFVINSSTITNGTSAYLAPGRIPDVLRRAGDPDAGFFVGATLTDRSVFDFKNVLLDGQNKRENSRFSAVNIALEQLLFDDRAGFELAYDKQTRSDDAMSLLEKGRAILSIDVNTHLLDGTPNPNFGRPYTHYRPEANYGRNEVETARFTAFGELDFARNAESRWVRWLGRHVGTVLLQKEETFSEGRSGQPFYIPDPFPYANNQVRNSDLGKSVEILHFLGPSLGAASTATGANIPGILADRRNLPELTAGGLFALRRQAAGSQFEFVPLNIVAARRDLADNALGAGKSLREIESAAFNLQSYFLGGHLVGSTGWRREKVETFSVIPPLAPGGEGHRLVDSPAYVFGATPDQSVSETLHSWSVVAKTPSAWLQRVPVITAFNVHYNRSENFSPPVGTRYTPFGQILPPPFGATRDVGFTLALANERLVLRANWYQTTQTGITEGTITGAVNSVVGNHLLAFNAVVAGFAQDAGNGFPVGYVPPPQALLDLYNVRIQGGSITSSNPGVVATTDFVAKGAEFEVVLNPTNNWTVALNAARQQSVRTNSGADAARLFFDTPVQGGQGIVPVWLATGGDVPLFITAVGVPGGSGSLSDWTQRFIVNPYNNIRLQDGGPARELRKWRFNAVTNYRFREGRLAGFSVGGAVRWQDKVAIGFPLTNSPSGDRIIDVTNPHYGPTEFTTDTWIGYERRIFNERITWKLQLNVRNLLGDDDMIPVYAQPTGEGAVYRIPESRTWTISSRFSF